MSLYSMTVQIKTHVLMTDNIMVESKKKLTSWILNIGMSISGCAVFSFRIYWILIGMSCQEQNGKCCML